MKTKIIVVLLLVVQSFLAEAREGKMSSFWARLYGVEAGTEMADLDNDGVSNLMESIAGTNPGDPNGYFKIRSWTILPTGVEISFMAVPGRYYHVYSSSDLGPEGTWEYEESLRDTNGLYKVDGSGLVTVKLPSPTTLNRFYRVDTITSDDSDNDDISDWEEVNLTYTNPNLKDSDGDGLPDGWEYFNTFNANNAEDGVLDTDGDTLSNQWEYVLRLNPRSMDSDGDGTFDLWEDYDNDGLVNTHEITVYGSNPILWSSVGDGLGDGWKNKYGLGIWVWYEQSADWDGDGSSNLVENRYDTSPTSADTDNDGVNDTIETNWNSDPLDPSVRTEAPYGTVTATFVMGDESNSASELYALEITPKDNSIDPRGKRLLVNKEYGILETIEVPLARKAVYQVRVIHLSTDPELDLFEPDFDYTLWCNGLPVGKTGIVVNDPQNITGVHWSHDGDGFFAENKSLKVIIAVLDSQTEAVFPIPRDRLTVGVGEEVKMKLQPEGEIGNLGLGAVSWMVNGGNSKIVGVASPTIWFTAGSTMHTATVTTTVLNTELKLAFSVLPPNGGEVVRKAGSNVSHTYDTMSAGVLGTLSLAPYTCSFIGIRFRKSTSTMVSSGLYASENGSVRQVEAWAPVKAGTWLRPSIVARDENISSGVRNPPVQVGDAKWPHIPMEYTVPAISDEVYPFSSVDHVIKCDGLTDAKVTVTADQATGSAKMSDPTQGN
jgi:hypothetical protein